MTDQLRPDAPVPPGQDASPSTPSPSPWSPSPDSARDSVGPDSPSPGPSSPDSPSPDSLSTPPYGTPAVPVPNASGPDLSRPAPAGYHGPPSPGPFGPPPPGTPFTTNGPGGPASPGAPWGAPPYASAPGPHAPVARPRRGATAAWIALGALFLVALIVAGFVLVLHRTSTPTPSTTAAPAAAPARPSAPASPQVPSAATAGRSAAPSTPGAPAATSTLSTLSTLSTVFAASAGPTCQAYTPGRGEYETSRGDQATEVRSCGATSGGLVFTRWSSPADAASVVSDQASFPSVDGRTFWTMNGTRQGDWHERTADDGSCVAVLDYSAAPYAVIITAPSCSDADGIFQAITLPDTATVPR